jgi:DNA-binding response OmpR family regulator
MEALQAHEVVASMAEKSLLVVEDDEDLADLVAIHLGDMGHRVVVEHDGRAGFDRACSQTFDVVILDINLPGMDGLEICRQLRAAPTYPAILMLTARSTELDRVVGLEVGADDYLTKPFSVRELVARVKALLRRMEAFGASEEPRSSAPLKVGELEINREARQVKVQGETVELTAKEFDLLEFFARNPGRVFTRAQLLDSVWGYAHDGYEHTVNTHINRLRRKIEPDPSKPRFILTVWSVGYKFPEASELEGHS